MREWEQFFPEDERKMYEKAGYKGKDQFGRNPALLIIDVITGFTGTKPMPSHGCHRRISHQLRSGSLGRAAKDSTNCSAPVATRTFQ